MSNRTLKLSKITVALYHLNGRPGSKGMKIIFIAVPLHWRACGDPNFWTHFLSTENNYVRILTYIPAAYVLKKTELTSESAITNLAYELGYYDFFKTCFQKMLFKSPTNSTQVDILCLPVNLAKQLW